MTEPSDNCVISVNNKGRGPGRPTLYAPKVVDSLLGALADGLTIEQACAVSGIGVQTLSDWKERHSELGARLTEAREQARQKALAGIRTAGEKGDWRALEAFLRMSFPADYRRDASINVSATATTQALVMNEETRMRMIECRRARQAREAAYIEEVRQEARQAGFIEARSQFEAKPG